MSLANRSILVIYNPKSTGPSQRNARRFVKRLEKAGFNYPIDLVASERPGHAEDLVVARAKEDAILIAVISSGDGGYNELVNGVMEAAARGERVIAGLLPSGNANDHYRNLHQPRVVERIKKLQTRHIDLLRISGSIDGQPWRRYAHSYIGFGVTSEVGKALNESNLNPANEVLITVKTIAKHQPFVAVVDGREQEFQSLLISNLNNMSKRFRLSKKAKVDDGLFEVTTAEASKAKLVARLAKASIVGLPHEEQLKSYKLQAVNALPVQLDGEVFVFDAGSRIEISIAAGSLECII